MRPLQLKCPNPQCRLMLMIPGEAFGQRVKCAGCGQSFVVPMIRITAPRKTRRKKAS